MTKALSLHYRSRLLGDMNNVIATGGPGDKSTLSALDLDYYRRYELIRPVVCCNSIAVLHYILVP